MQLLPATISKTFQLADVDAFRMASLNIVEPNVLALTDDELRELSAWLGSVFALAVHEQRRRRRRG